MDFPIIVSHFLLEVRRMGRLVRDDRKATVTQITNGCNQVMQNTISKLTTRGTLTSYRPQRPRRVPLLLAKNHKLKLQFTQAHQNRIEDWKNVSWSDESGFQLQHSDSRVRIWFNMNMGFINASVWWCNGVWDTFLAHLLSMV